MTFFRSIQRLKHFGSVQISIGLLILLLPVFLGLFANHISPYDPAANDLLNMLQAPSLSGAHPLGTDDLGRDMLSRLIHGAKPVLIVAFGASVLGVILGAVFGLTAGYLGGGVGLVLSRLADIQLTVPGLTLALLAVSLFGSDIRALILILAIESWPLHFRVIRRQAAVIGQSGYVEAARLAEVSLWRILPRHILPGVAPVLVSTWAISASLIIMTSAGLSFIGLGIQPPTADWGLMIAQGKSQLAGAWWLSLLPALALVWLISAVQIFADGLSKKIARHEEAHHVH